MWCCVTLAAVGVLLTLDFQGAQSEETSPAERQDNANCECGVPGSGYGNRIVGGQVSKPHMYPWIVELRGRGDFRCEGSIINDHYILTAGHCVQGYTADELIVVLSVFNINDPRDGIQTAVDDITIHPGFSRTPKRVNNDIALLRLKYPIQFSRNISPICLPRADVDYENSYAVAAGWGRVSETGRLSNVLRETGLKIVPYATCKNTELGGELTDAMICAHSDDSDTCKGDSGAPLMVVGAKRKFEVVGVVSWGWGCDQSHLPGVYTNIQHFLGWIDQHTQGAMYCKQ